MMSSACAWRGIVPQTTRLDKPLKTSRAVHYGKGRTSAGKWLSATAPNRPGPRRAPTLLYAATPGQSGGGSGGVGGGGSGGGGGGGSGPSGGGGPRNLAFIFAALLTVGGYMGYKKKGSTASLKASGGFAAVLVLAGYLIGGPYNAIGLGLALAVNLVLGVYMAKGYLNTKKIFPQLVFSVICAANTLTYVNNLKTAVA